MKRHVCESSKCCGSSASFRGHRRGCRHSSGTIDDMSETHRPTGSSTFTTKLRKSWRLSVWTILSMHKAFYPWGFLQLKVVSAAVHSQWGQNLALCKGHRDVVNSTAHSISCIPREEAWNGTGQHIIHMGKPKIELLALNISPKDRNTPQP